MSTLENNEVAVEAVYNMKKGFRLYVGISIFCLIFSVIYSIFSHGVKSPYMTWLALIPAVLGAFPALVFRVVKKVPRPGRIAVNLYNSGVAAVTVSSLLRGIFEIAGTGSEYQVILMYIGLGFLILGILTYIMIPRVKRSCVSCLHEKT